MKQGHYPRMSIISAQSLFNSRVLGFGWLEVLLGVRYSRSTHPPTRQLRADAGEAFPNIFIWRESDFSLFFFLKALREFWKSLGVEKKEDRITGIFHSLQCDWNHIEVHLLAGEKKCKETLALVFSWPKLSIRIPFCGPILEKC